MVRAVINLLAFYLALGTALGFGEVADEPIPSRGAGTDLFLTSDRCLACHNGLISPSGEDVSLGTNWRSTMMANSARDPYWQAAVRREVMDHPSAQAAIEHECAACHMPMTRYHAKVRGSREGVFSNLPIGVVDHSSAALAADGVSCTVCHQIQEKDFGAKSSFTAGFFVDTSTPLGQRKIYGPYAVEKGLQRIMESSSEFIPEQSVHIQSSEMCATCHTLFTHTLSPEGKAIGELPEQVPYLEWRQSAYRDSQSCQDCHMKVVEEPVAISSVLGQPREAVSRHSFRGGNFFMPRILNRYRDELGVTALSQELEKTVASTSRHLETEAALLTLQDVDTSAGKLSGSIRVESLAGHKLPTAYPSRRVWIHLEIRDGQGRTIFESGGLNEDGSIIGNANDKDRSQYEPHYSEINDPGQVQIYEVIMGDPAGNVTTGLLTAIQYLKDNRILPKGFDKSTVSDDVKVRGRAADDSDFLGGGDTLRFSVDLEDVPGPYSVEVELRYQPIAYRWAHNLVQQKAFETERFVSYYNEMAGVSSISLARRSTTVR